MGGAEPFLRSEYNSNRITLQYEITHILSKEDKAIVFDLKSAEVYQRFSRKASE